MKDDDFSEILKIHGDLAYRMACHLTHGNETLARDLVQDAFVKIWKNWAFQRPQSFKGWLYRILHNLYMDHLRRKGREGASSYDMQGPSEEDSLVESYPDQEPHVLDVLEQEELKKNLHAILRQMPDEFRIQIILCDMEDLSYEEIAQVMACPVGTVRSRIHRGRRELRRAMRPYVDGSMESPRCPGDALVQFDECGRVL